MEEYKGAGDCFYARILGFRKDAKEVLSVMKHEAKVPILTKLARAEDALDEYGKRMLQQEIFASNLYESVITEKFSTEYNSEYRKQIVRI